MCGIAGIMTRDGRPPEAHVLDRLEAALAHRGPDGHGHYAEGNVGMVQTRLAIIDLQTGDQPIFLRSGDATLAKPPSDRRADLASDPWRTAPAADQRL